LKQLFFFGKNFHILQFFKANKKPIKLFLPQKYFFVRVSKQKEKKSLQHDKR
jgi:hypothetical protein